MNNGTLLIAVINMIQNFQIIQSILKNLKGANHLIHTGKEECRFLLKLCVVIEVACHMETDHIKFYVKYLVAHKDQK